MDGTTAFCRRLMHAAARLLGSIRARPRPSGCSWRAGFGPRRGEAQALAAKGLDGAVHSLTHPPAERWVGPRPHDEKGRPLAPADAWGHDHLWWLDRMVRTSRPLVERMTLVWHDWFATSDAGVGSQKLMLAQNRLLRRSALGRFDHLLVAITANPAMLLWLSGTDNRKGAPNENYGRELMELFTLGEGNGYTESDVREQARALTGWTSTWTRSKGQIELSLRPDEARPRCEDRVRQAGRLHLARLGIALRPSPEARRVLRRQAVGLLRPGSARCEDARRAGRHLHARLRGGAGARGDSSAPGAVHRPAHGEVACRLHRRPPARARPRGRHHGMGLAGRGSGPAALLSAERGRVGRLALARHEYVPRPLVNREHRSREGLDRRPEGQEGAQGAERSRGDRQGRAGCARGTRRSARRRGASCSRSPVAR